MASCICQTSEGKKAAAAGALVGNGAAVMGTLSVVVVHLGHLYSLQAVLHHYHYTELVGIELIGTEPELVACLALMGLLFQVKKKPGAWLCFHNLVCT